MYEVELTHDSDDVIHEGRRGELDNLTRHYLMMQSDQQFSIKTRRGPPVGLPPAPLAVTAPPPIPPGTAMADFDVIVPGWSTVQTVEYLGVKHTVRSPVNVTIRTNPASRIWSPVVIPSVLPPSHTLVLKQSRKPVPGLFSNDRSGRLDWGGAFSVL